MTLLNGRDIFSAFMAYFMMYDLTAWMSRQNRKSMFARQHCISTGTLTWSIFVSRGHENSQRLPVAL